MDFQSKTNKPIKGVYDMKKLDMKKNEYTGNLISFCGLDGCGKTTMISKLNSYFKEKNTELKNTKQPTGFVRESEIFRTFMDCPDHEAFEYRSLSLLAASDRVQHTNKIVVPWLREGYTVISDRYFYSCIANLHARGYEDDQWIYEVAKWIIKPDFAFFLDVPVELAIERVRKREYEKERYIDIDLQYKLRDLYLKIAEMNNGIIISTEVSEEETFKKIKEELEGAKI